MGGEYRSGLLRVYMLRRVLRCGVYDVSSERLCTGLEVSAHREYPKERSLLSVQRILTVRMCREMGMGLALKSRQKGFKRVVLEKVCVDMRWQWWQQYYAKVEALVEGVLDGEMKVYIESDRYDNFMLMLSLSLTIISTTPERKTDDRRLSFPCASLL